MCWIRASVCFTLFLSWATQPLSHGVSLSHYGTKPVHFETSKIHFPTSEGVSERANGRASGPVLTSLFLFVPDHSAAFWKRSVLTSFPPLWLSLFRFRLPLFHYFLSHPIGSASPPLKPCLPPRLDNQTDHSPASSGRACSNPFAPFFCSPVPLRQNPNLHLVWTSKLTNGDHAPAPSGHGCPNPFVLFFFSPYTPHPSSSLP